MRKKEFLVLLILVSITVSGCKSTPKTETKIEKKNAVEAVIDEQVAKLEEADKENDKASTNLGTSITGQDDGFEKRLDEARNIKPENGIDYDLTTMGSDMVYATVYLMMTDPSSYEGKKVKMSGQYYAAWYEPRKTYYNYCFISDAAGCCSQGIEFAMGEEYKYPNDFPDDDTDITVIGTFETYMEDGKTFCHLKECEMQVIEDKKGADESGKAE